jgi:hypothetical protein
MPGGWFPWPVAAGGNGGSGNKVREPEKFDGNKPAKLEIFLNSCRANFAANPQRFFNNDRARITYAGSYFTDTAMKWYGSYLEDMDRDVPVTPFLQTWAAFVEELNCLFGIQNPRGDAATRIRHIRMHNNDTVAKFMVAFKELADKLPNYGQEVLGDRFWDGLCTRIQDAISFRVIQRPTTLNELYQIALNLDNNYWSLRNERRANEHTTSFNVGVSAPTSGSGRNKSASFAKTMTQTTTATTSTPNKSQKKVSKKTSSTTERPRYAGTGADSKVTPEEKQRRLDNNLCAYCGSDQHSVEFHKGGNNTNIKPANKQTRARASGVADSSVSTQDQDSDDTAKIEEEDSDEESSKN